MKILLLNPNSSLTMTQAMILAATTTPVSHLFQIDAYTAPKGSPVSINDEEDIASSTKVVLDDFESRHVRLIEYDAVLVSCFSVHSLVSELSMRYPHLVVLGIFEASIMAAFSLICSSAGQEQWGIITTGDFWKKHIADGVSSFFDQDNVGDEDRKFRGVYSTGLTAHELHSVPLKGVQTRIKQAASRLFGSGRVSCVIMGCGGMVGLEDTIRRAAREVFDTDEASRLYVIDAVKAGILQLNQVINSRKTFR